MIHVQQIRLAILLAVLGSLTCSISMATPSAQDVESTTSINRQTKLSTPKSSMVPIPTPSADRCLTEDGFRKILSSACLSREDIEQIALTTAKKINCSSQEDVRNAIQSAFRERFPPQFGSTELATNRLVLMIVLSVLIFIVGLNLYVTLKVSRIESRMIVMFNTTNENIEQTIKHHFQYKRS